MRMNISRLSNRTIPATLAIALTLPLMALAADGYNLNSVYVGGGGGKSQIQDTDGKSKTSGKAFLGHEFNKAFSLEAGYVDLGKHDTGGSNTVRERGPFIEALVHFAISESFSPFLKGGVHRLEVATRTSTADTKESNTDPIWGAGFNFNIGEHMGVRLEWERFTSKDQDTDLVSANIVHYYR
jgi:OmpA-OmpF porin, OOP family